MLTVRGVAGILAGLAAVGLHGPAGAAPAPPAPGPASTPVRFALRPSATAEGADRQALVYDLPPGETVADAVELWNLGRGRVRFELYATDAFTTRDGTFALLPGDRAPRGVGRWVQLGRRRRDVPGGARVVVPFRLRVPPAATPGDHVGGIVAAVRSTATDGSGQLVAVDRRIGVRLSVRVAGPRRPALAVSGVAMGHRPSGLLGGRAVVRYRVANVGNVRLAGLGTVEVRGVLGIPLARAGSRELPEILPGSSIVVSAPVGGVEPAGPVTARVRVAAVPVAPEPRLPRPVTAATSTWLVPTRMLALLAAGAAVGGVVVGARRVRRRRSPLAAPA